VTVRISNPRIRVAAIIVEGDKILLARHEKKGKRYWVLPGGGVDFAETMEEALVRELNEEASVVIRVHELVLANDSIPPNHRRHIVNMYFTAEIVSGKVEVGKGDKRLVGMKFVPIEKLPRLKMFPDVRKEVFEALQRGFKGHKRYLGNMWKDM
jgi:ADP-ribose pyrophosphatase YjhB (NUDIX family)